MKKLWLVCTFALSMILLTGCMNKVQENVEIENLDEGNIVETDQWDDIINEEGTSSDEVYSEMTDGVHWDLLAFNWFEVDWNYSMTIKDNKELYVAFCNSMWWSVTFDWENTRWRISASLISTEMACEWESMDLENAFEIDWGTYSIRDNEDWWKTMVITTINWDKFTWRTIES